MENESLSLLAYKIGPAFFDISTALNNVSIRDQIVRSHLLATDMVGCKLVEDYEDILVVGASIAGLSFALAASHHGKRVTILDIGQEPLHRFQGVTKRLVGANMYEWPAAFSNNQEFPQTGMLKSWATADKKSALELHFNKPVTADTAFHHWRALLKSLPSPQQSLINLKVRVCRSFLNQELKDWQITESLSYWGATWDFISESSGSHMIEKVYPKFIVLAAGFGPERGGKGNTDFWANDALTDLFAGHATRPNLVISGGGDGALQDCVRSLYSEQDPLTLIAGISAMAPAKFSEVERDILVYERQHQLALMWSRTRPQQDTLLQILDGHFKELAITLANINTVADYVISILRTDIASVSLIVREAYFTKAYPLNRLLVYLTYYVLQRKKPKSVPKLLLFFSATVGRRYLTIPVIRVYQAACPYRPKEFRVLCTQHVERTGVEGKEAPAYQLLGVTDYDETNRANFSKLPMGLATFE